MPMKRLTGAAAVWFVGVCAGTNESRRGNPSVTPTPRRKVRRGMYFFEMNICLNSLLSDFLPFRNFFRFDSHLKRSAFNHSHRNRGKLIMILVRFPHNPADYGHILIFHAAAD